MIASNATSGVAAGALGAGLVPSKTKVIQPLISFAPSVVAERRVKRLKKSVWASGHLHGIANDGFRAPQVWFVTLTYVGVHDWASNHIKDAVNAFRRWCKRKGVACRYTWVAELQSRGAVHYHLLAWLPHSVGGRPLRMPQWDRSYGSPSKFWLHGMSNCQVAKSGVGYLMKYLSKLGELTRFPKGLRLYGIGGLDAQARDIRSWFNLPEWVKRSFGVGEVKRSKCGIYVRSTGEILEAAYELCRVPYGVILRSLRELPEKFHSGAYSSVSFS